jgi:hypothetical protein
LDLFDVVLVLERMNIICACKRLIKKETDALVFALWYWITHHITPTPLASHSYASILWTQEVASNFCSNNKSSNSAEMFDSNSNRCLMPSSSRPVLSIHLQVKEYDSRIKKYDMIKK